MRTKEYFYRHNFLEDIISSKRYLECNQKKLHGLGNKFYCFLLKKYYRAKNTAIDYCNKTAYLQYDHIASIEDDRISSAHSRIVELHYPNLKTLFLSLFKRKQLI